MKIICNSILIAFFLFYPLLSNNKKAALKGKVYNSSGKVVPNTRVTLLENEEYYITDVNGYFEFTNLMPQKYSLLIEHVGYQVKTVTDVDLTMDSEVFIDSLILNDKIYKSEEIVISASRIKQKMSEISIDMNVVNAQQIMKLNSINSAEALREQTGISVQKTNHGGGSVKLRGFGSNQILILVDGVRLNNSTYRLGNHQYLTTVDNTMLSQIEVVKGPMSVLYGSDALGGTISLFTKEFKEDPNQKIFNYNLLSRYATADKSNTINGNFMLNFKSLNFSLGSTFKNIGDLTRGKNSSNVLLEQSKNGAIQKPSGFKTHDIDTKLKYQWNDKNSISFAYQYSRQFDVPRYDKYENENYFKWLYKSQERDLLYLKYENNLNSNIFKSIDATLSYHKQGEAREIQKEMNLNITSEEDNVRTLGFTLTAESDLNINRLIFGLEFYSDYINSNRTYFTPDYSIVQKELQGKVPDDARYNSTGIFMKYQFDFYNKFTFTPGVRYSYIVPEFKYQFINEQIDYDNEFNSITGSFGMLYDLSENIKVKSNLGQAFRAPNLSDLAKLGESKGGSYEIPNPDLKPEELYSIDLGVDFNYSSFQSSFTYFYSHISDIIESSDDAINGQNTLDINGQTFNLKSKQNLGRAYIRGLESRMNFKIFKTFLIYGDFTSIFGHKINQNEPVDGIPPMFGQVGLLFEKQDYFLQIYSRFADKQNRLSQDDIEDPRIPDGGTPAWTTFNIRSQIDVTEYLTLNVIVENIFDINYREHGSGINAPGRNFIIGLKVFN